MTETTVNTNRLPPEIVPRVLMTVQCRDADGIPKVPNAGEFRDRDGTAVQVMHNGVVVEAGGYFGDWMAEIIRVLHGHHEPQEELVFHRIVERLAAAVPVSPVIVELGSFWAYYSLWFCARLPGGRAVLMEPDEANLDLGRRNFALNEMEERGLFVHGVIGPDIGASMTFTGEDGTPYDVEQFDLASLMKAGHAEYADVLLSDIQGAETLLLEQSLGGFLPHRVRFLIVSTHHHSISGSPLTHQHALQSLRNAGAFVIAEHSVPESASGDGLIAVSFDERDKDFSIDVSHVRASQSLFGEVEWDLAAVQRQREQLAAEVDALRSANAQLEKQLEQGIVESQDADRGRIRRNTRFARDWYREAGLWTMTKHGAAKLKRRVGAPLR